MSSFADRGLQEIGGELEDGMVLIARRIKELELRVSTDPTELSILRKVQCSIAFVRDIFR
jgi:hypothetical protein